MKHSLLPLLLSSLLLTACAKLPQEPPREQSLDYEVPAGDQKYVDPVQGRETWFAIGALAGVSGVNANGVAQAHFFQSGMYRMELQLNIERAKDGEFYQVWLAKEGDPVIVSAGQLHSRFGDARHSLTYESADDLRAYTNVIVTREVDDGNPQPNVRVAEGTLVEKKR
ncbi:MAG: anti-sigma factor [Candidatus Peribacteraceae bacterium]|nr:anti-sigma factor [Candidatus Peribacteraceae bacterium]